VKIGILTLVITQLMNLAFIGPLKHAGSRSPSLGACLNAALLYRGLRKVGIYTPQPGWPVFVSRWQRQSASWRSCGHYDGGCKLGSSPARATKLPALLGLVALGMLAMARASRSSAFDGATSRARGAA